MISKQLFAMLPYIPQFISHPSWLRGFLGDGGLMKFPNVVLPDGPMPYADVGAALAQSTVCWDDLQWIRKPFDDGVLLPAIEARVFPS